MATMLDVRGLSCPIPLIKVRDALHSSSSIEVWVDDPVALQNIIKFVCSQGYSIKEVALSKYENKLMIEKG